MIENHIDSFDRIHTLILAVKSIPVGLALVYGPANGPNPVDLTKTAAPEDRITYKTARKTAVFGTISANPQDWGH
jgi:hypothetical protein